MVKVKFPKGLPFFRLNKKVISKVLNDMADTAVNQIRKETLQGKDIEGKKFKRLKLATIKDKKRKGYSSPTTPLVATGLMSKVWRNKTATTTSLESRVGIAEKMKEIAEYHIEGAGNLPKRVFFGIGKTLKSKLNKLLLLRVGKVVKTTWRKK